MEILRSDTSSAQPHVLLQFIRSQRSLVKFRCDFCSPSQGSCRTKSFLRSCRSLSEPSFFHYPWRAFTLNMSEVSPVFHLLFYCRWWSVWKPLCFRQPVSEMDWAAQKCQGMISSAASRVSREGWCSNITQHNSLEVLVSNLQRTDFQILQVSCPLFRFISLTIEGGDRVLPIPALIPLLLPMGSSNFPHLLRTRTTNFHLFYMSPHNSATQTLLRPKKHLHVALKTINQLFFLTNDECSTAHTGTYTFSAGIQIFRVVKWIFMIGT